MADVDYHAKLLAHRAHLAAVPAALVAARNAVIDFNGRPMVDGEAPRDGITCGQLRTLIAEVDRLQALVDRQRRDAIEAEREFSREAREIAAEARWQGSQGDEYGSY